MPRNKARHAANQRRYMERGESARQQNLAKVNDLKRARGGCLFCRETHSRCLEWHHKSPEDKRGTVSQLVRRVSWDKVIEEIGKCVLLCSNCHKKLHGLLQCRGYDMELLPSDDIENVD